MSPRMLVTITCVSAAWLLWAGPASADPAPATQPDGPAAALAAPTTQPDAPVAALAPPTTQPELAVSLAGFEQGQRSQIPYILTRKLPPRLQAKNRLVLAQMNTEQRQAMRDNVKAILSGTQRELETYLRRKNRFELLAPEVQERYREKANLIDQVLDQLSPTEQAKLLSLPPQERAKRVLELAADLKVQQTRPGPNPKPAPE